MKELIKIVEDFCPEIELVRQSALESGFGTWRPPSALVGSGVVSTLRRTVPNARRLGGAQDTPEMQSTLARSICRDHLFSFARTSLVLGLQLIAR